MISLWQVSRSNKEGWETTALWASLIMFSEVGAALVLLGKGPNFAPRYSPNADGFWIAFVALSLLATRISPKPLAVLNITLLIGLVVLTVDKDYWLIHSKADPYPSSCDRCVVDYPLHRSGCLRQCFEYSEDQSAYHLAALRLSAFRHEEPQ